jgi:hypothetical protein
MPQIKRRTIMKKTNLIAVPAALGLVLLACSMALEVKAAEFRLNGLSVEAIKAASADLPVPVPTAARAAVSPVEYEAGDIVLYGDSLRRIEALDNDGTVVLMPSEEYNHSYASVTEISKVVKAHGRFKMRDTVIHGGAIRTIEFLDNTGRIVLKATDEYNRTYTDTSAVSKVVKACGGYSVGDTVLHGESVRAIEFMGDVCVAGLKATDEYNLRFVHVSEVSKVVSSFEGYRKGETVLYRGNSRTIEYLDNTGVVVLEKTGEYDRAFVSNFNIEKR